MSVQTGKETEYAEISYDESIDAVSVDWKQTATGDDFREILQTGLEIAKEETATNWLGDRREMDPVTKADQEWVNETWLPEADETELTQIAAIQSEQFIEELDLKFVMQKVADDLTLRHFDSLEDATEWLWY
jgi:hypothetical protein